jgi:homoserine dehydrogenase
MSAPITIALLGGGTVGSAVAKLLVENSEDLAARIGRPIRISGIAVRDASKSRGAIDANLITTDANALAASGADIVIEVIGGIEPAKTLIETAIANGSSVVTANKALLASHGAELHAKAMAAGVDLFYEASVAGAIPLLRPLRESLAGDKVLRILGIVNGTTNFILSKMYDDGADYADVLAQAQALGYAEADPTADVEGFDSAGLAIINDPSYNKNRTLTRKDVFDTVTSQNPFSNVLLPDLEYNVNKKPAPPAYASDINSDILMKAKQTVKELNPDQPDISEKLFKDLGEQLEFEQSMRNFYSNPNTTVCNDQAAFAEFCYGSMISCKEGNLFACARNLDRHTN